MKHLIPLMKEIEIDVRSNDGQLVNQQLWKKVSDLSEWENQIILDFILRVRLFMQSNNLNMVWRYFEKNIPEISLSNLHQGKYDICIASLRRNQNDVPLTDARNRLYLPSGLNVDILDIFGLEVVQARNLAINEALKRGAKKILFIDDDILAPVNSLPQLLDIMEKTGRKVVAGDYYKKIEPLTSAHVFNNNQFTIGDILVEEADLCAMGFCLIDLSIAEKVPLPFFWAFGDPDDPRYWLMGEDAFFTKNLYEYVGELPVVIDLGLIHYDKQNKKLYGDRNKDVIYASNQFSTREQFDELRTPQKTPKLLVGIPTRNENDIFASNIPNIPIPRNVIGEIFHVWGLPVDEARTRIVKEALERECDYLLFIDDDVILPYDAIYKLFDHIEKDGVDIISANYPLKGNPPYSIHLQLNEQKTIQHIEKAIPEDLSLFESNWLIGLGCVLIDMRFFKQAREPWFICHNESHDGSKISEDAHMCELAKLNGFHIWVDKSIACLHIDYKQQIIYVPSNIKMIDINSFAFNPQLLNSISEFKFEGIGLGGGLTDVTNN